MPAEAMLRAKCDLVMLSTPSVEFHCELLCSTYHRLPGRASEEACTKKPVQNCCEPGLCLGLRYQEGPTGET